jgi:hypothetical protein
MDTASSALRKNAEKTSCPDKKPEIMSSTMPPLTEQQAEKLANLLTEVGFPHRPAQTNLVWHVVPDDEAPPHEVYESCLHQMWQDETDEATADAIAKARAAAHKQEVNQ